MRREKIEVEYRELPAVVDAEAAMASDAPRCFSPRDSRQVSGFDYEYGNEAAVNRGVLARRARHAAIARQTRVVGNPMEPKAALAAYDAASENLRPLLALPREFR